jgi:ectoine hydroxylase-related dioxygenase (phytanoyl-CoA dioxygenase family)
LGSSVKSSDWLEGLERDGFAILEQLLLPDQVSGLRSAAGVCSSGKGEGVLRRGGEVYGVRDLVWRVPEVRNLAQSPGVMRLVEAVLGPGAFVVRGLFFDKTPAANWNLPWHQDVTIAVKEKREVTGFGPWTLKAGIRHVHAPGELLARMITIRIHLDECGPGNGPMRVLPGSHARGRLAPAEITAWAARAPELAVDCLVPAGGAVLMRPLILHASASATVAGHRRVIHLEYAAEGLPGGLEWYEL